jgi:hypothetical protein
MDHEMRKVGQLTNKNLTDKRFPVETQYKG